MESHQLGGSCAGPLLGATRASMAKYRSAKYQIAKYRTQDIERQKNIEVAKISKSQNIDGAKYRSAEYRIAKYLKAKYRICIVSNRKVSNTRNIDGQNIESTKY